MFHSRRLLCCLLLIPITTGCGEDLIEQKEPSTTTGNPSGAGPAPGSQTALPSPDPKVKHERDGEGYKTRLDATDRKAWVYLDLDDRAYPAADAAEGGAWDLAFRRVNIRLNGGISGKGNVGGTVVEGQDAFDKTKQSPGGAFEQDKQGNSDPNNDPFGEAGLVFGFWYDYEPKNHVVTPKPRTYIIQSNQGKVFKLQILDYHNQAKTSAHYTVRWAPLPPQNHFFNYALNKYKSQSARILAVIPHDNHDA